MLIIDLSNLGIAVRQAGAELCQAQDRVLDAAASE